MLIKFAQVAAFFMHLRYDSKWFSILFVIGMLLAVGTYLALEAMVTQVPPLEGAALRSTPAAEPAPVAAPAAAEDHSGHSDPAAEAASAAADSAAGPRQFSALGCGACHLVSGVTGAVGAIGPSLDGLGSRAASRVAGQDADTYLRTSLLDPNAYVVEGYMKMMPPVAAALGETELAGFIAWLKSL